MKTKRIIGIVGSRNTGKTTITIHLTNLLTDLGYKVAIIKFMHHKFDFDPNQKDSAVLRNSKASTIISASPYETVVYHSTKIRDKLNQLLLYIPDDTDIILCESYPANYPEIPLIFACKEKQDYIETKDRYNNRNPIFITGDFVHKEISMIKSTILISNTNQEDLKKGIKLIIDSTNL